MNRKVMMITVSAAAALLTFESTVRAEEFIWPVPGCGNITSDYGWRGSHLHNGIDISCGKNEKIVAAASGKISSRTYSSGQCQYSPSAGTCPSCDNSMGNSLTIRHESGYHTAYLHLKSFTVNEASGTPVTCGQQIGVMGTTGCSTGTHLHFTILKSSAWNNSVNPHDYVYYGKNTCPVICKPTTEVCDGADNDCDGQVDEGNVCDPVEEPMYQSMNYDRQNTDVDGDGKADICARGSAGLYCTLSSTGSVSGINLMLDTLKNDNGWTDPSNYATIRFADYNGDGKADVCARANDGIMCWPSKGTSFGSATNIIPMRDETGYTDSKYYSTIRFADINGDGKDDFCARYITGFYCYLSQGDHWPEENDYVFLNDMADKHGWNKPEYYSTIRMADINGDGKADVCARGSAGFRCWISNGTSFETDFLAIPWSDENGWNKKEYYSTIRMPDLNGDGKADACIRDEDGIECHLSQGTSFGPKIQGPGYTDAQGWADYDNYSTINFADFNGDGKDDICIRANAGVWCHESTGSGFGKSYDIPDFKDDNGFNKPDQFRTIRMGDIDGDHKAEVCGRFPEGIRCYKFNGEGFTAVSGPSFDNGGGWDGIRYYSTIRIGGPAIKSCSTQKEVCDQIDNNCNGQIDEGGVCCKPSEEICDQKDNDCDGEIDEGGVCDKPECIPQKEICDQKDNDCDGEIDEGGVCDTEIPEECVPEEEICDQKDNDCDGEIDEGDVCNTEVPEECVPEEEICDQKDNDCDGKIDEDGVCDAEVPEDCVPEEEICDQKDNDCDGKIDEGGVCKSDKPDECVKSPEVCDDIDNDCDGKIDEDGVCDDETGSGTVENDNLTYADACSSAPRSSNHAPFGAGMVLAALLTALGIRRKTQTFLKKN